MFTSMLDMANGFRSPWPVHITDKMDDLSQADAYQSNGLYVWFQHPSIHIRDGFPLAWIPDENEEFNIHLFPYCKQKSKKIIRWNALKLVPTCPHRRRHEIKQNLIAGYDRNNYNIFFVSRNDPHAIEKFRKKAQYFPYARLIHTAKTDYELSKKIMKSSVSKYVWIIDIDVDIDQSFELYFEPTQSKDTVYTWPVKSAAYQQAYPTGQISLYPYSYFCELGNDTNHTFQVVDKIAGNANNTQNPLQAYTKAFLETMFVGLNDVDGYDFYNLATFRLDTLDHNLKRYIQNGIEDALELLKDTSWIKSNRDKLQDIDWIKEKFKSGRQLF